MVRRRKNSKMKFIDKLIAYKQDDLENINELSEDTGYNFTEIQRKINNFFFSDVDNLDEVFGELEESDDEEEESED
jgi:hypothetical protein